MRRAPLPRCAALILDAAVLVGAAATALAQGTEAQRQACAPDAIRLCQDAIPDVGRTTACMRAHATELSPGCRRAFAEATQAPLADGPPADAAPALRRPPREIGGLEPRRPHRTARRFDDGYGDPDLRRAKRVLDQLCASQVIGANTCDFTAGVMRLAE